MIFSSYSFVLMFLPVVPTVLAAVEDQPDWFADLTAAREAYATLGVPHLDAWDNATWAFDDC